MYDIPVTYCEITNNTIKNFSYRFLCIGITNEIPYEDKLYDNIRSLKVENNNVVCEDDWWGETTPGSYYTFVSYEGDEVIYNNNYVEGMKTKEDVALYDAYLSARLVNYTNNTWKNNICFTNNNVNNTLLKAKSGGNKPLIRNYVNNTFIVEEQFAKRVGQSSNNLFVYFISLDKHADSYNIKDNLFDVYELRFPASSISISNFSFCGNTVKAKKASGNLALLRSSKEFSIDSVDISDNTIDIGSESENSFTLFTMIDNNTGEDSIKKVNVNNNRINGLRGYIFYEVRADELSFCNNVLKSTISEYPGFAYGGKFINTNISNNTIESLDSKTFYEGRQKYGRGSKSEVLNITRNNYVNQNNGMQLDIDYNSEIPTTYKRLYTFFADDKTYEFYFMFTLRYDPASKCAQVTFKNIEGETNTFNIGGSTEKNESLDGSGQFIELIDQTKTGTGKIPFKVRFFNSSERACFYITEYYSDFCEMKIETVSFTGDNVIS